MAPSRLEDTLLNLFGNGYGTLGLVGPQKVAPDIADRVRSVVHPYFGHSDWLSRDNLLRTLKLLHRCPAPNQVGPTPLAQLSKAA